jgi:putative mRNA 3-end processing factor
VYVTHGFTSVFARWLNERGMEAAEVETMYGHEEDTESAQVGAEENNSADAGEGDRP